MVCSRNIFLQSLIVGVSLLLSLNTVLAANIDATVNWSQRVEMSTGVSGMVAEVNAKTGERVEKGQLLLALDATRYQAAVLQARAAQRTARYALAEAKREWERAQELYDRTVLSDRDLQLAENAYVAAQASQAKADAALANADKDLADSMIRAPFAAVVIARQVEVGQTVVSQLQAVPMLTLAASDAYIARGRLTVSDLSALRIGEAVDVSTGGQRYRGEIVELGMEPVDAQQGLYAVAVRFPAATDVVRFGQHAVIHLP
ncbi:efflux RND transporter periplasmic adaptor subunit [Sulfuriflexus mobilis]|uniref:efflux RND transporter periplasmic adaptor subunit n=1 Tax=Sulfuriflexus mobilis TaxID=1811807 RepID=UPI000F8263C2|nr:efflux RND transporter periplasmic adaptor subunit [Sulfuriflexus mobilis]